MKRMKNKNEAFKKKLITRVLAVPFFLLGSNADTPLAEAASSGRYGPGDVTITDTNIVLDDQETIFKNGDGTYTISNSDNNTLTVTGTNSRNDKANGPTVFPISGNKIINGNLDVTITGALGYRTLNSGGSLVVNGNFTLKDYLDGTGMPSTMVGTHSLYNEVTFNGDFDMYQEADNIPSAVTSVTTMNIYGTTNMNGNVKFITKADRELSSGLNGIYVDSSQGGPSSLNITGAGKTVFLQSVNRKSDILTAKGDSTININTGGSTQIIGNLDTKGATLGGYGGTGGVINAVLSGEDSFWYGDQIYVKGTLDLTLNNGAEWGYFGDNGVGIGHYVGGKGITQLTLNGGYVNLFDDYLHQKWVEYGLVDQYEDIMDFKHDYVYIGDLKGDGGYFRLDLNSNDKADSDMIYVKDSTEGAGYQYLQAHDTSEFDGVTPDNTLRFATVGPAASDTITFHDTANIYGKTLWDYKLLIGSEDYDVDDPENAVYNAKVTSTSYLNQVAKDGAKNWFIYDVIKDPTGSMETAVGSGAAVYHMWREHDQLMKRMGDLRHSGIDEKGIWFRMKGSRTGRDGTYGFDSKYRHYELGYDEIMKETDKFIRYGGVSLSYTDMDNGYNQGQGDSDGYATNFYVTQMGNKGHYLDVVFKVQHIDSDFTAYNKDGSRVTGDFENTGISLSAEYGRKKMLDEDGWYIEPQAQLTLGYLGGDRYKTSNNIEVRQGGIKSALGRLGFNLGKDIDAKTNIYIKGNWLHEFGGSYKADLYDPVSGDRAAIEQGYHDTWFEYGIGAAIQTGKNNHVYFDIERSCGSDFKKDWNWNVGARWTF